MLDEVKRLEQTIKDILENVACLGRDAYGIYIDGMTKRMISIIQNEVMKRVGPIGATDFDIEAEVLSKISTGRPNQPVLLPLSLGPQG